MDSNADINAKTLLAAAAFSGLLSGQGLHAHNPGEPADGSSSPCVQQRTNDCDAKSAFHAKDKKS